MYNLLTVKSDIVQIGKNYMSKPNHLPFFFNKGYYIYESYRIFDEVNELNIMLGKRAGRNYIIISNPDTNEYRVEEFSGASLNQDIRYLDKEGLKQIKRKLIDDKNSDEKFENMIVNSEFRNQLQICINNIRLKYIMLLMAMLIIAMTTVQLLV